MRQNNSATQKAAEAPLLLFKIAAWTMFAFAILFKCTYHPTGRPSESGLYYIDACPTCECRIISYGGSQTTLGCTDSTGHFTEVKVMNEQVHAKK